MVREQAGTTGQLIRRAAREYVPTALSLVRHIDTPIHREADPDGVGSDTESIKSFVAGLEADVQRQEVAPIATVGVGGLWGTT